MHTNNWIVPVTIEGDYWSVDLYYGAMRTAAQAKAAAEAAVDALATYVKPLRPFIVGEPEELT